MLCKFKNLVKDSQTLGSTFIVAGTMIGAGMLAMPLTSISIGFTNSLFILLFMSVLMLVGSFIQADLLKFQKPGVSFAKLVALNLGDRYQVIPAIIKCLLFYSLLANYITGSALLIQSTIEPYITLSFPSVAIIFSVVFGAFISFPLGSIDRINRLLVIFMFGIFIIIIYVLNPQFSNVQFHLSTNQNCVLEIIHAVPVFFTAFGFHGSIPALTEYLKNDQKKIYTSFILGIIIALGVYFIWQLSIVSLLEHHQISMNNPDLKLFLSTISSVTQNPSACLRLLYVFYFCVIITSFIGVGIGLFRYLYEVLTPYITKQPELQKRFLTGFLTLIFPCLFACFYPDGFIMALKFAGIWLCLLALILPAIMGLISKQTSFVIKMLSLLALISGCGLLGIEFFLQIK